MDVDFHQLTNLAQKHDYEALYRLKYVAATIIKTWAKREKQELKWMASNEKTVDYSCIIDCIIEQLITGNRGDLLKELTFPQFKTFLIETFRNRMAACFSVFLSLLKGSHDQAWQIVFNDLENHSAAWFYKNRLSVKYNCHAIFSEAFEILYSNYIEKDLEFRDSCAFKSYFFKILDWIIFRKRFLYDSFQLVYIFFPLASLRKY